MSYLDTLLERARPRRQLQMTPFVGTRAKEPLEDPFESAEPFDDGPLDAQAGPTRPPKRGGAQTDATASPAESAPSSATGITTHTEVVQRNVAERITAPAQPERTQPASDKAQPTPQALEPERRPAQQPPARAENEVDDGSSASVHLEDPSRPDAHARTAEPLSPPTPSRREYGEASPTQIEIEFDKPEASLGEESGRERELRQTTSPPAPRQQLEPVVKPVEQRDLSSAGDAPDDARPDSSARIHIGNLSVEVVRPQAKKTRTSSAKKKSRQAPKRLDFRHRLSFGLGRS